MCAIGAFSVVLVGSDPLLVGSPKGKRASMKVSALPVGSKIGFGRVERTLHATFSRVQIGPKVFQAAQKGSGACLAVFHKSRLESRTQRRRSKCMGFKYL